MSRRIRARARPAPRLPAAGATAVVWVLLLAGLGTPFGVVRADVLGQLVNQVMESLVGQEGQPPSERGRPPDRRNIPEDARVGTMSPPHGRLVSIDGRQMRLSPGCRIRDHDNRVVLPVTVRDAVRVRYTLDRNQQVHRVWIVSR